jgi:hypothetical protein
VAAAELVPVARLLLVECIQADNVRISAQVEPDTANFRPERVEVPADAWRCPLRPIAQQACICSSWPWAVVEVPLQIRDNLGD